MDKDKKSETALTLEEKRQRQKKLAARFRTRSASVLPTSMSAEGPVNAASSEHQERWNPLTSQWEQVNPLHHREKSSYSRERDVARERGKAGAAPLSITEDSRQKNKQQAARFRREAAGRVPVSAEDAGQRTPWNPELTNLDEHTDTLEQQDRWNPLTSQWEAMEPEPLSESTLVQSAESPPIQPELPDTSPSAQVLSERGAFSPEYATHRVKDTGQSRRTAAVTSTPAVATTKGKRKYYTVHRKAGIQSKSNLAATELPTESARHTPRVVSVAGVSAVSTAGRSDRQKRYHVRSAEAVAAYQNRRITAARADGVGTAWKPPTQADVDTLLDAAADAPRLGKQILSKTGRSVGGFAGRTGKAVLRQKEADNLGINVASKSVRVGSAVVGAAGDLLLRRRGIGEVTKRLSKKSNRSAKETANEKIKEAADENLGIDVAYKSGRFVRSAGYGVRDTVRFSRHVVDAVKSRHNVQQARKMTEQMLQKKGMSSEASRKAAKAQIKRQMIQRQQAAKAAKKGAAAAKVGGSVLMKYGAAIVKALAAPKVLLVIGIILVVILVVVLVFELVMMLMTSFGEIYNSTYLAQDYDLTAADAYYTQLETNLRQTISNQVIDNPDANLHRLDGNVGAIRHDTSELLAYLTVKYDDFTYGELITLTLDSLFAQQYGLTQETALVPGSPEMEHVMTLTVKPLREVLFLRMNEEEKERWNAMEESGGNRQLYTSPVDFSWRYRISSPYGYRLTATGQEMHTGMDVLALVGTAVYAGAAAVVEQTTPDSIALRDDEGNRILFWHVAPSVTVGTAVSAGDTIGTVLMPESGEPRLHIELRLPNALQLNPYIYFEKG